MTVKVRESIAIAIFALACGGIAGSFGNEFFAGIFAVEAVAAGLIAIFIAAYG